jgi:hypothetical protein
MHPENKNAANEFESSVSLLVLHSSLRFLNDATVQPHQGQMRLLVDVSRTRRVCLEVCFQLS